MVTLVTDEIPQNLNDAVKNDYRHMKVINGITEEVDGNLTSCKYFGITSHELTIFEKTSFMKVAVSLWAYTVFRFNCFVR